MKIIDNAITSSVFELIKTIELDIRFSEDAWTTRIELFGDTEKSNRYRCRVWELELFRLTPTFPQNEKNEPEHITDDLIMVERGIAHSEIASTLNKAFDAPSIEAALEMIIDDLKKFLKHVAGEQIE